MKLSSILRRSLPFTPTRAGIPPTWDRPDPPETKKTPRTRYQNMDDKHFTFFDAASPTYMLVNSEVAEGDLGEAFPSFAKNLAALLFAGFCVGSIGFLWSNRNKLWFPGEFLHEVDKLQTEKSLSDQKYGLKDLQNNPWKLNVWPESFPVANLGIQEKSASYEVRRNSIEAIRKINKEALAYWTRLQSEAEKAVQSGAGGHH